MLEKGYQYCPECYMIAFDYACMLMNDYADVYKAKDILSDCVHKLPQMPNNWAQLGIAYIATQEPEMAKECFINWSEDHYSADFMTVTYSVTEKFQKI